VNYLIATWLSFYNPLIMNSDCLQEKKNNACICARRSNAHTRLFILITPFVPVNFDVWMLFLWLQQALPPTFLFLLDWTDYVSQAHLCLCFTSLWQYGIKELQSEAKRFPMGNSWESNEALRFSLQLNIFCIWQWDSQVNLLGALSPQNLRLAAACQRIDTMSYQESTLRKWH